MNDDGTATETLKSKRTSIYTWADTVPGVIDANKHHEWPQMFFVTVLRFRHLGHHFLKPNDC
jgi:hypothetical protein